MNKPTQPQNILISACLLGNPVRYDGTDLLIDHPLLQQWKKEGRLISICPEVAGGLSTPRAPAEIVGKNGASVLLSDTQVINNVGEDVTKAFVFGANKALQLAKANHCIAAVLTERSPSCGSNLIYDGSFSGARKSGMGVTTALLEKNGIRVFNQYQLEKLQRYLIS
ncbi:MAG: DUF523 domain-containing protein [Cocleimonas sp.]|nr:DUF523 domain-containing protein [Cocleimonas sp.]